MSEFKITNDRLKVLLYNTIALYEEALDTDVLPLEDVLDELGMSKEEYCEIMGVETC